MNKYFRLIDDLKCFGEGKMKAFGNSMQPILESGSLLTFKKKEDYEVGDIVFSKIRGKFIDAHKIVKKDTNKGYLIANNKGHENGWTKTIYGKVVEAESKGNIIFKTNL